MRLCLAKMFSNVRTIVILRYKFEQRTDCENFSKTVAMTRGCVIASVFGEVIGSKSEWLKGDDACVITHMRPMTHVCSSRATRDNAAASRCVSRCKIRRAMSPGVEVCVRVCVCVCVCARCRSSVSLCIALQDMPRYVAGRRGVCVCVCVRACVRVCTRAQRPALSRPAKYAVLCRQAQRCVCMCTCVSACVCACVCTCAQLVVLPCCARYAVLCRGGGLGSSTIFKKFNEPYAPS